MTGTREGGCMETTWSGGGDGGVTMCLPQDNTDQDEVRIHVDE